MALILPKSIFVHIPKTGGTWVRRAIEASMGIEKDSSEIEISRAEKWGEKAHATIGDIKRELGESLEDRFIFSFVRKPLDLLKSMYIGHVYPEIVDFDGEKKTNDTNLGLCQKKSTKGAEGKTCFANLNIVQNLGRKKFKISGAFYASLKTVLLKHQRYFYVKTKQKSVKKKIIYRLKLQEVQHPKH